MASALARATPEGGAEGENLRRDGLAVPGL